MSETNDDTKVVRFYESDEDDHLCIQIHLVGEYVEEYFHGSGFLSMQSKLSPGISTTRIFQFAGDNTLTPDEWIEKLEQVIQKRHFDIVNAPDDLELRTSIVNNFQIRLKCIHTRSFLTGSMSNDNAL